MCMRRMRHSTHEKMGMWGCSRIINQRAFLIDRTKSLLVSGLTTTSGR